MDIRELMLVKAAFSDIEKYSDGYAASVWQEMVISGDYDDNSIEEYIKQAFKDGAEWHEAQLLKNSVVTQIRELPSIDKADERVIIIKDTKKKLDMSDYAVGDRVRIVFIKTKED